MDEDADPWPGPMEVLDGMLAHFRAGQDEFAREQLLMFHREEEHSTCGKIRLCLVTTGVSMLVISAFLLFIAIVAFSRADDGLESNFLLPYRTLGIVFTILAAGFVSLGGMVVTCSFAGCQQSSLDGDLLGGRFDIFGTDSESDTASSSDDGNAGSSDDEEEAEHDPQADPWHVRAESAALALGASDEEAADLELGAPGEALEIVDDVEQVELEAAPGGELA
mmetsp:Transcript_2170/g.7829  ORF Transcript_2170/g.7829 Transcript_2170/m.7829 type:complete len:222 (-) Transcript_2170:75-740(-)